MTVRALILPGPDLGHEFKRWSLAAAIVCAAHFGLMAGYLLLPAPSPEGSAVSPAVILELAPMPVAPSSQQDIAPGPEMVEAQATPKLPLQAEPEVVDPTPKMEAPVPAEVTLPESQPKTVEQKPEEIPDTQETTETSPVPQSAPAPRTTAAPRSEQHTAPTPRAPNPGSAASREALMSWRDLVMARLQQNKRYPGAAEARRDQGVVTLSFTVDRNGRVLSRSIARSSGVAALDEEVLAMVQRAQPLPAFPPVMGQSSVNLTVPIRFSLR
ncbi:MAG: energy transducer TonB [Xanthobacteraceae bacterium]|nr:energy transducer TonB [Xanthobacteraceae bacterium]